MLGDSSETLLQPSYNVGSTWPENFPIFTEEIQRETSLKSPLKIKIFFPLLFMDLTCCQSFISFCSFPLLLLRSSRFQSVFLIFTPTTFCIFPLCNLHPPLSFCCHPFLVLFLFNNNCWPSVERGQAGEPAKLARASTLLLPSDWGLFNAPLESFQLCLHSSLHPSLFPHKTATKKAEENL